MKTLFVLYLLLSAAHAGIQLTPDSHSTDPMRKDAQEQERRHQQYLDSVEEERAKLKERDPDYEKELKKQKDQKERLR